MDERDRKGFRSTMLALVSVYRVELTTNMEVGYWLGLQDLELPELQAAAKRAIMTSRFMPTPAELRELAPPRKRKGPSHEAKRTDEYLRQLAAPRAPWPEHPEALPRLAAPPPRPETELERAIKGRMLAMGMEAAK